MTTVWDINLFYPLLFLLMIITVVTIGIVLIKNKDNNLFGNIFNRHVDEHIDTTEKFSQAHTEIVKAEFTVAHEKELHHIQEMVEEINDKLDDIIERVIELEKRNR